MNERELIDWGRLEQKCDKCKLKFKCFTTNTSNRPQQLVGINFQIAKCCIRCKNGKFKTGNDPEGSHFPISRDYRLQGTTYLRVGSCSKHNVSVHQFSYCDDFDKKLHDNLSFDVQFQIQKELAHLTHNYKFPRYCIIDNKHIGTLLALKKYTVNEVEEKEL